MSKVMKNTNVCAIAVNLKIIEIHTSPISGDQQKPVFPTVAWSKLFGAALIH